METNVQERERERKEIWMLGRSGWKITVSNVFVVQYISHLNAWHLTPTKKSKRYEWIVVSFPIVSFRGGWFIMLFPKKGENEIKYTVCGGHTQKIIKLLNPFDCSIREWLGMAMCVWESFYFWIAFIVYYLCSHCWNEWLLFHFSLSVCQRYRGSKVISTVWCETTFRWISFPFRFSLCDIWFCVCVCVFRVHVRQRSP